MNKFTRNTLLFIFLQFAKYGNGENVQPEFTEPIKNITISEGSNVEFSCMVKNLGKYRVMWLKKDQAGKEAFVGINLLKISTNPRLSITLLQTSNEVTQSTIYIRGVEIEDEGIFECAISSIPVISQTGTLELSQSSEKAKPQSISEHSINFETSKNWDGKNDTECSEMKSFWDEAADSVKDFIRKAFTSLVNFTCSFLGQ